MYRTIARQAMERSGCDAWNGTSRGGCTLRFPLYCFITTHAHADEPFPFAGQRLFAHPETGNPMAESERARSLNGLSERLEELRRHL
jgi:hypothetical protein